MKFRALLLIPLFLPLFCASVLAQEVTLSREDRDRLVRIEEKLEAFIDSTNQRFDDLRADMNARFEQVDQHFEQVDKRFEELRADMNARFKQVDQRFAELRADMNTRFKQVDKRFEEQQSFLQMIVAAFAGLVAVVIGFALWDRRTMIKAARQELQAKLEQYSVQREQQIVKRAVEESYERIEARGLPRHFVTLLRERASHDPELSGELKNLGLL